MSKQILTIAVFPSDPYIYKEIFYDMKSLQRFLERTSFGVCSKIGERLGIQSSRVRLYFIYASFLTFGSPLVIYLVMAFWLNIKKYIRRERDLLWE